MEATPPKPPTLRRYGLTLEAWQALLAAQGGVCAICGKLPASLRLCVDHEHARGWKKMQPEERRKYIRGLLCWVCNHYYCGRGINTAKARGVVGYLERYAEHRAGLALREGLG